MSIEADSRTAEKTNPVWEGNIWFRLPPIRTSNDALAEDFRREGITTKSGNPITPEWITKNTGIAQRYREPGQPHLDAPLNSSITARKTLEQRSWQSEDIDLITVITSFPIGQNLAAYLKKNLGFRNGARRDLKAETLEVNAACSGFTVFLNYLKENEDKFWGKKVLLIATEQYSPYLYGLDRAIFSDFTLGMTFEYGKDLQILASSLIYEEDKKGLIRMPLTSSCPPALSYPIPSSNDRFFEMEGPAVLRWAVKRVPPVIEETRKQSGLNWDQIKLVIPHQANQRITDKIQEEISVPVYSNIQERGNTSSVSIPLALADAQKEKLITMGDKVIWAGFGAGLLICVNVVQLGKRRLPLDRLRPPLARLRRGLHPA